MYSFNNPCAYAFFTDDLAITFFASNRILQVYVFLVQNFRKMAIWSWLPKAMYNNARNIAELLTQF